MTDRKERQDVAERAYKSAMVAGLGWPEALKIAVSAVDAFDRVDKRDALAIRRDALAREITPDSGKPVRYWDFDKDIRGFIDRRIALEDEIVALRSRSGRDRDSVGQVVEIDRDFLCLWNGDVPLMTGERVTVKGDSGSWEGIVTGFGGARCDEKLPLVMGRTW